jgi:RNA polymerase sigma factor (sigma-70 family)
MARRDRQKRRTFYKEGGELSADTLAEHKELHDLVNELPDSLSRTVMLRYFAGHSAKEVARQLQISINAVNIRTHRAIIQLRNRFTLGIATSGAGRGRASSVSEYD